MPKIKPLTMQGQLQSNVSKFSINTEQLLVQHRIKKKDIAELVGVTPAAITQQFRNQKITIDTYIAVQMLIESRENK